MLCYLILEFFIYLPRRWTFPYVTMAQFHKIWYWQNTIMHLWCVFKFSQLFAIAVFFPLSPWSIFSVKIYVNLAKIQAVFNVYCSYKWWRLQSLLAFLILSPILTLGFSKYSSLQQVFISQFFFSCKPLLYWSSIGVVEICKGGDTFYNFIIKYQSFIGLVSLGCECSEVFL